MYLCLGSPNWQKLRWKFRIYVDEKSTFLKEVWHIKGKTEIDKQ